jgi:maltose O-acetyltransferase
MVPTRQRLDPRGFAHFHNVNNAWWHWTVNVLAASPALSRKHRSQVLARAGIDVGTSIFESGTYFWSADIEFGPWCMINDHCYFDSRERITLGERVGLSPYVMLLTSGHHLGSPVQRFGQFVRSPITIEDGAWLGARVIVLGGVTIGAGAVVAAGAVVTKDLEPNGLYAGIPAKRVKDLPV